MSRCQGEGATHHTGCACHEEAWKARVESAYAAGAHTMKLEMLRVANRMTDNGQAWPGLMIRLREVTVHEGEDE